LVQPSLAYCALLENALSAATPRWRTYSPLPPYNPGVWPFGWPTPWLPSSRVLLGLPSLYYCALPAMVLPAANPWGEHTIPPLSLVWGFGLLDGQCLGLLVYMCSPPCLIAPYRQALSQLQPLGGEHTVHSQPIVRGLCLLGGQSLGHLFILAYQCPTLGIAPYRQSLSLLEFIGGEHTVSPLPLVWGFGISDGQRLCRLAALDNMVVPGVMFFSRGSFPVFKP
jgi:hypothetical protein